MSEEKKSIAQLLRTAEVFRDPHATAGDDKWREALLLEFDGQAVGGPVARPDMPAGAPLRPRHLLLMAPAGVALFFAGWWVGRGGVSSEELAAVPVAAWLGCAGLAAGLTLIRRGWPGLGIGRRDL
jgi:hypothetical protein